MGYGHPGGLLGYCVSAAPATYDVCRRIGRYRSRFISNGAEFRFARPFEDREEAQKLRDSLNVGDSTPESADELTCRADVIEELRAVFRQALVAFNLRGELDPVFDARAWEAVQWRPKKRASPLPVKVVEDLPDLDHPLSVIPDDMTASAQTRPQQSSAFDASDFPFAAAVFDLDQTLLDTSTLEAIEEARRLVGVKERLEEATPIPVWGTIAPHELPAKLRSQGIPVAVATRSPERYARALLNRFEIPIDDDALFAGTRDAASTGSPKVWESTPTSSS